MINIGTDRIQNWIFVTGSIRGGTTFLADVLSTPLSVDYIHEPFNLRCGMPGIKRRYRYIADTLETPAMRTLDQRFEQLKRYDFELRSSYYDQDPYHVKLIKKAVGSRGPFFLRLAKVNYLHRHCVVKDPTAPLIARRLHTAHQFMPVIIVRHPASLIGSLNRVGWWPKISELFDQPAFIRDCLSARDVAHYHSYEPSALTNACFHWLFTYRTLLEWAETFGWPVVTHEALCADPVSVFRDLFDTLNLPWSRFVARKIRRRTGTKNSPEARNGRVQDFSRDSARIFEMRRDALSAAERQTIFEITQDVAMALYTRRSFNLPGAPASASAVSP